MEYILFFTIECCVIVVGVMWHSRSEIKRMTVPKVAKLKAQPQRDLLLRILAAQLPCEAGDEPLVTIETIQDSEVPSLPSSGTCPDHSC
jgi:hypothetical protein